MFSNSPRGHKSETIITGLKSWFQQDCAPLEAVGKNLSLTSSSFLRLLAFLDLWQHLSYLCLIVHIAFSLSVCQTSLCLFLKKTFVVVFMAHVDNIGLPPHLKILYLTHLQTTFFFCHITFMGALD